MVEVLGEFDLKLGKALRRAVASYDRNLSAMAIGYLLLENEPQDCAADAS